MQANTARMNNIKPETEKLMAKIKHHNRFGQHNLTAIANKKLLDLYREHKCSPLKLALTPFVQIPIFISFFIALRRMAAAPVESMKTGGTLWFTDLTQHDPYYVLPFISCGLLLATIEMGGEAGVSNPQMEKMKTFFRAFTILLIPITAQFPTGLFMYWLPSSIYSIAQILLLKLPPVKSRLGIPDTITTPSHTKTAASSKGFFQMVKDNYRSANVDNEAKTKKASARKRYNQLLKDKSPKLYDKPPHLRQS
ncbi:mitochondrial inner membrane protein OXA1L-like isoform X2 [Halichondria panicea]